MKILAKAKSKWEVEAKAGRIHSDLTAKNSPEFVTKRSGSSTLPPPSLAWEKKGCDWYGNLATWCKKEAVGLPGWLNQCIS